MPRNARALASEIQRIWDDADAAGRDLTSSERGEVEGLLESAESQQRIERGIKSLDSPSLRQTVAGDGSGGSQYGSPGSRFVNSDGYKRVAEGNRGKSWSTGMVDVGPLGGQRVDVMLTKGTLLEGTGSPGSGTAGGLLPVPQVVPGVVQKLFQPLTVETLISTGQAEGNTVRYINEGTALSAAAGVLEGGTKPESTLALSTVDEAVKKTATTLFLSDEVLEDAAQIQSYVSGRLGLFVGIEVERQLLRGTAGNELSGFFNRGIPIYAGGTADGDYASQLFHAFNGVRGSAFLEPEWVVMHPTDWQKLRLLRDTTGQYLGGGPFLGAYGQAAITDESGQVTGAFDTVWGKPVHVTSAIGGAGTALIGNSRAAQVFSRGGARVEMTNSHGELFVTDVYALRCERRLALCCYRTQAFCEVRFA